MDKVLSVIVCALPAEAKPLVDHYRLKKLDVSPWSIYQNDNSVLIVSGMGKIPVANAIGFTAGRFPTTVSHWLNVGIGGHATVDVGQAYWAQKISCGETGKSFYPVSLFPGSTPPGIDVITVPAPIDHYEADAVCDMEAWAFCQAALHYSSSEFVHAVKVVSDNESHGIDEIEKQRVSDWIEQAIPLVDQIKQAQLDLAQEWHNIVSVPLIKEVEATFRLSVYEKKQMVRLLRRMKGLAIESNRLFATMQSAKTKQDFYAALAELAQDAPVSFSSD